MYLCRKSGFFRCFSDIKRLVLCRFSENILESSRSLALYFNSEQFLFYVPQKTPKYIHAAAAVPTELFFLCRILKRSRCLLSCSRDLRESSAGSFSRLLHCYHFYGVALPLLHPIAFLCTCENSFYFQVRRPLLFVLLLKILFRELCPQNSPFFSVRKFRFFSVCSFGFSRAAPFLCVRKFRKFNFVYRSVNLLLYVLSTYQAN